MKRVAVPFGDLFSQLSTGAQLEDGEGTACPAERAFPNNLISTQALFNGRRYWALIQAGNPNPSHYTQADLDVSGWTLDEDFPKVISDDLKTPAASLGISSDPVNIHRIAAQQYLEFTNMNGQRPVVSEDSS